MQARQGTAAEEPEHKGSRVDTGSPLLMPLGERALVVRFADRLEISANRAAVALARALDQAVIAGVQEVAPNLVSVLVRYDPKLISYDALCGEVRLALAGSNTRGREEGRSHALAIRYGGADGPDFDVVAQALDLTADEFVALHTATPLRVLAVGFAPGFLYAGMHAANLVLPRRESVRGQVPPGSVLFAAGQTAIAATTLPTGWSVIGRTKFINFDPIATPPVHIVAGDTIVFERQQ